MNRNFWRGKRVFVTGHTGFKGGWLVTWLADMGAVVTGYSLTPPTTPNFFTVSRVESMLKNHFIGDVRDEKGLAQRLHAADPEIIFHLAAQPLVRYSYAHPIETFAVNIMGTINLLETARTLKNLKAMVNVTTDKCYENLEREAPYQESESLGGHDPYSASKACSEIITASYRRSFLLEMGIHLASARAGNVIGGGDWAADRLVPDFLRALDACQPLLIRSPSATRPWQHVLEPVAGYISLAQHLFEKGSAFAEAWNFGPAEADSKSVDWIATELCRQFPGATWKLDGQPKVHEAGQLQLNSSKAQSRLGWKPHWNITAALQYTAKWHLAWRNGEDMQSISLGQIRNYEDQSNE